MGKPIVTPCPTSRCQAITDLIESVALQEAALSRILDAESEKLQKAVDRQNHGSPDELLKFNRSVDKTIRSITLLEVILQGKLQLFSDCLCPCPDHHPSDCTDL